MKEHARDPQLINGEGRFKCTQSLEIVLMFFLFVSFSFLLVKKMENQKCNFHSINII